MSALPPLRTYAEFERLGGIAAYAAVKAAVNRFTQGLAAELERFPGMLRRLERKGSRDGAVVYDDYAHHPTEVAAALAALRELGPDLWESYERA